MTCRVAINRYGRIGQCLVQALYKIRYWQTIEIVAINELANIETLA